MSPVQVTTLEGNEAVAYIAYRTNEICSIYPITPSSTMAELADQWASEGKTNIWGNIPLVVEMQSEAGAAGAVHGALQTGALTTTFTASQGLLLMIPNMYKIAGELTPAVFHVAARALAAQGLSIFGDHSDVAAVRNTGFAQLASSSVQEAHDMALLAQAATLESRIPFVHFFDGFRTSHEVNKIELIGDEQIRALIDADRVREHRARGLNPDNPFIRGTAQNPDIYFQARETVNPFYQALPQIVQDKMDALAALTGRQYRLFDYFGHPQAERVAVIIGSGAQTLYETVDYLQRQGEKVGVINVRLCLPFSSEHFLTALPATTQSIALLDRVKLPGSSGEPLYGDVLTCLSEANADGRLPTRGLPRIVGGRYGLSSKEFTPAMAKAVLDELKKDNPKNHFTIGINDDITLTSLDYDPAFDIEPDHVVRALFIGLGADGTVGANKNSIKIIGESTPLHAQGYFVYDSKKSGSRTVSHVRFGPKPILSPYLIQSASFIGCHQFGFVDKMDVLANARDGATFLLDSPYGPDEVWQHLPQRLQRQIIDRKIAFYVIDASSVARATGMGNRTNTIMQTCFFAISGVLPRDEAIAKIKQSIKKTYGKKGDEVVNKNFLAVDRTLEQLHRVAVPSAASGVNEVVPVVPVQAPEFVRKVTAMMMAGAGDQLPVSMLPIDGTYPSGTTQWEKRNISAFVPHWEPDICIQCGNCSFVCPHAVIRSKFYPQTLLQSAPENFKSAPISARGFPETRYTLQIYVEDCTGCALCVEVCPAKSLQQSGVKAINMKEKAPVLEQERANIGFFEQIPVNDRARVDFASVRGAQFLEPLFEFSGACAGCGETPYVRLLSQLFGDRLIMANATGCSSIYGGNLPTTPWTKNGEGRGPAWSNSLFEDNAEFGLGFRLTADKHLALAHDLAAALKNEISPALIDGILDAPQTTESQIRRQRIRVAELKAALLKLDSETARDLLSVVDHLVRRSVWIMGGDGWAYDIGSGGVDHVLASGRDINILVLDTEVYSNTGGQMSKATPMGAVAKFAAGGKPLAKKDLALQAISYGNVYVARIAMGANPQQTLLALREAEAYPGPSLVLAYSHCIAHGINMQHGLKQQDLAVASGHWPLVRYNPALRQSDRNPFVLDSPRPHVKLKDYAFNELRYKMLARQHPAESEHLMTLAQQVVNQKWEIYEEMASRSGSHFHPDAGVK
ncbi:pyruvate:ferredoxin (flavodoxin) oxidoreductase [Candidatus Methylospira mobilis]|uniref:Pyruvate-flavodoxin oxidoreductase n=1 Tax=Candidatus Methylospira mobilis TaxID=1808979 RepID=A0A5Q0BFW3_9GAMM|nr:pyruvate:ferredoxin (flavodoxin) oxidoreductase [Candidatus Methylospira mobilis]QFY42012.1 pyruvate:ferredoxin (flavodoxin) oxidoreductase [Candidatus Methylospira mobilis]